MLFLDYQAHSSYRYGVVVFFIARYIVVVSPLVTQCFFFVSVFIAFKPQNKEGILPAATLSIDLYGPSKCRSSRDIASEVWNFVIGIININE